MSQNDLSKKYQKKSDKQHVLDNPDTYIGSIEKICEKNYIYDNKSQKIIEKEISYIPGLYKLFDEGIVSVLSLPNPPAPPQSVSVTISSFPQSPLTNLYCNSNPIEDAGYSTEIDQMLSPSLSSIEPFASVGVQSTIGFPPVVAPMVDKFPAILIPEGSKVAPPLR